MKFSHFGLCTGVALSICCTAASARTVSAFSGHSAEPLSAIEQCFVPVLSAFVETGGVRHTCRSMGWLGYTIPLPIDYPGVKRFLVRGNAAAGAGMTCGAVSYTANAVRFATDQQEFPTSDDEGLETVRLQVTVPPGGTAFVTCLLQSGAIVHSVDYNP